MKKNILITLMLCGGIITPFATQATIIQLLEDNLQMETEVYSEGHPGTITQASSYGGSLFSLPGGFSISSNGEVPCQSPAGLSAHQWATAYTDYHIDPPLGGFTFYAEASSGWNQACRTAYPWGNQSTINIDLKFKVIPVGENNATVYIENHDSTFALFDHTVGEEMTPGFSGSPYFGLLDNHTYTLSADVVRVANQDSLPYAYNDPDADLYYAHFNAIFVNSTFSPVPEPSALMLFGLGLGGLLLTTSAASRREQSVIANKSEI